jgi:hypothetical protein
MTDEWDYGVKGLGEGSAQRRKRLHLPDLARAPVWSLALSSSVPLAEHTPVRALGGPNARVCLTFSLL